MKKRIRKIMSLLLAASMVFTMNTVAFGDESVAEDAVFKVNTSETARIKERTFLVLLFIISSLLFLNNTSGANGSFHHHDHLLSIIIYLF